VIQHFSKPTAAGILGEIGRVLHPEGRSIVQMPNRLGLKAVATTGNGRNSRGSEFDVRRYAISELLDLFERRIGASSWRWIVLWVSMFTLEICASCHGRGVGWFAWRKPCTGSVKRFPPWRDLQTVSSLAP
jgi:hypothetical protein